MSPSFCNPNDRQRRRTVITAHRSVDANVSAVTLSVIVVVVHNVSHEIDNRAKWPFPSRLSYNDVVNYYYYLLIFTNNSAVFTAAFVPSWFVGNNDDGDDDDNKVEWRTINSALWFTPLLYLISFLSDRCPPCCTHDRRSTDRPKARSTAAVHAAFRTCRSAEPGIFESPVCVLF